MLKQVIKGKETGIVVDSLKEALDLHEEGMLWKHSIPMLPKRLDGRLLEIYA